jgi:hypothetical protein
MVVGIWSCALAQLIRVVRTPVICVESSPVVSGDRGHIRRPKQKNMGGRPSRSTRSAIRGLVSADVLALVALEWAPARCSMAPCWAYWCPWVRGGLNRRRLRLHRPVARPVGAQLGLPRSRLRRDGRHHRLAAIAGSRASDVRARRRRPSLAREPDDRPARARPPRMSKYARQPLTLADGAASAAEEASGT